MSEHTPTAGTSRVVDAKGSRDGRDSHDQRGASGSVTDPETSVFRRQRSADELDDEQVDDAGHANAFVATLKFCYRYSTALIPASVLWVVCSLPLVTVGPASVGVYSLVLSLRETGRVDRGRIVETVREQFVPATLLGFLPATFVGIALLYILSGLATGIVGTALTAVALYGGVYVAVLLIPTFVSMAGGVDPKDALRESYLWLAGSPVTGLQLLLVTGVVLVATVTLSIGFLLLFAGTAAAYHVEVISRVVTQEESLPSFAAR